MIDPLDDPLILRLPFPPTVNTYWRHVTVQRRPRVLLSKRGREFRDHVGLCVLDRLQRAERALLPLEMPLQMVLDLHPPTKARRDVDNYAKAVMDALEHAGVYPDDTLVQSLLIRKHPPAAKPGFCVVTLRRWYSHEAEAAA